jgi:ABC-2 type transport system permease protein
MMMHIPAPSPIAPQVSRLRRYASLYAALWRNSVVREMMFKSNFLLWIFVELLWFSLQLCFMAVLYSHTNAIGDWSKWQVVALVGASHVIQQIFQAFFLTNLTQLSELVRSGKLDVMLLLPVNTRFVISLRQVDLGGFVNAGTGLAVIVYACAKMPFVPGPWEIFVFLALCGVGVLVHYSLMFLLASVSFWTVRAQGIIWGYYSMFNIARMPDAAFRGVFKMVFTFALPMLLISNVPARRLLGMAASALDVSILLLLGAAVWVASEAVFRFSMRRYTSASS